MRKPIQVAFFVLMVAAAFAQQVTRSSLAPANVVARVNGVPLLQRDVDAQAKALFPFYSVHGGQVPASAQAEIHQKAMDRVLLEELLFQEARRRGITATPVEVNARVAAARKKSGSKAAFEDAIDQAYGSEANFRAHVQRAVMIDKLWNVAVTRASRKSDAELLKFYRENKSKFVRPEAVQLQTISFMFDEKAAAAQQEQAHKRAEGMLAKAQATKSVDEFGALAEKSSEDDWRVMNGDHGWVHKGTVEPELDPAFQLKPGQVSGIIRSRVGYHIMRVNGYRAAQQLTFVQVKKELRAKLEKDRQEELRSALETTLKAKSKIEYARGQ